MIIKNKCPFCGGKMVIKKVKCVDCNVQFEGDFDLPDYVVDEEVWNFIKLYFKVRGNLKEVERILGLSYPTVRARFEEIRKALGFNEGYDEKSEIITLLEKGEISVEEALKRLDRINIEDEKKEE